MALRRFAIAALWATGTAVSLVSAASYDHVNSTAELPVIVKRDVIPDDNSWVKLYIVAHLCCVEGFRCASKESVSRQVDIMNEKLAMAKIWFDILLVEWVTDERCGRTNVGDRWGTDELKRGFYVGDARVLNFLYLPNNQGDGAKGLSWDANPYAYDANMLGNLDGCTVAMDTLPGMDEGDDNQPAANPPARLGSGSGILSDLWSGVTRFFSRDLHEAHTGLARRGYLKETEWVSLPSGAYLSITPVPVPSPAPAPAPAPANQHAACSLTRPRSRNMGRRYDFDESQVRTMRQVALKRVRQGGSDQPRTGLRVDGPGAAPNNPRPASSSAPAPAPAPAPAWRPAPAPARRPAPAWRPAPAPAWRPAPAPAWRPAPAPAWRPAPAPAWRPAPAPAWRPTPASRPAPKVPGACSCPDNSQRYIAPATICQNNPYAIGCEGSRFRGESRKKYPSNYRRSEEEDYTLVYLFQSNDTASSGDGQGQERPVPFYVSRRHLYPVEPEQGGDDMGEIGDGMGHEREHERGHEGEESRSPLPH
ncbi:hypothetical protein DCS_06379 [Drechmeria coniospora]|uniref:Uncharacterized protein n=1 Tax=Drechmeria coniospora TaxID=98403 RepID=A0A151GBJ6_DRECN|nr:hypothetical protein DCS_06379 [Drechmeria coniospora]KYK54421.1 hypothetical protein DCS_06379 [Drechmeria coniospora]